MFEHFDRRQEGFLDRERRRRRMLQTSGNRQRITRHSICGRKRLAFRRKTDCVSAAG